ncbi:hypothetical protein [Streptomyces meridianus]|uniref:Tat pathway signal sequence domain protein n=1 Tax=Streptomyces meridianus TaxID=2938945 RepID=A0ABT0XD93_9ACTN|nr:hypothetical protein [Streptomyces meridianus]MCM2580493.1 hypothetical protein [Streptomyces meridianus]
MSFGQGGPFGPGGEHESAPDWAALAEEAEARGRRRRWMLIGGGVLATLAIGGIVATAVIGSGRDDGKPSGLPSPESLPSETAQPEPSFSELSPPPPPNPHDFVADARKDTAPLSADTLFPGGRLTLGGGTYAKGPSGSTTNCAAAASSRLAAVLTGNGCTRVIRATYRKKDVAVTVGVAVFANEARAKRAKAQAAGNIQSLSGGGVPSFCRATACRLSANSYGRYAYFTVSGYLSGAAVTASDTAALRAGKDISGYAFSRIVDRGVAQASAAAERQAG